MKDLQQLASAAKTQDEADYGTDRQIDTETLFFDTLAQTMPSEFGPDADFYSDIIAQHMTGNEAVDAAMVIVNKLK